MELMGESGWKLVSALPSLSNVVTALANGARGGGQTASLRGSPTEARPTCQESPQVAPGR